MLKFDWDKNKNKLNIKKHGISFEEASTVFYDDNAILIPDPEHSIDEDRFVLLGISKKVNVLVVVHCYRQNDEIIRIISARNATKNETLKYAEKIGG
ncbi:MAG: BrnT family toxin [Bacilli bacterium]|nr:BrnT family toxin [Bacilli bacterium]